MAVTAVCFLARRASQPLLFQPKRFEMRVIAMPLTVGSLLLVGLLSPSMAQPTGACAQIADACKKAGFGPGTGITDCIRPIMAGTPQQKYPQIDPQVVAACKQQNPKFGAPPPGAGK